MITLVAALAENNAIGLNNDLLWHLPDDFKHFKALTSGHYIIMGRKTFESFPKPLPNRTHLIITRQTGYTAPEGCFVFSSLTEALDYAKEQEEVFVIGGGEIYTQSLPFADKLELTRVHATFDADTFFPEFDTQVWQLEKTTMHEKDEKHAFSFTFQTFIRNI